MSLKPNNQLLPQNGPGDLEADTRVTDGQGAVVLERRESGLSAFDKLGSYELLKRLGGGGMADVFLARSALAEGVDKLVALKTALPEFGPDTKLGALFLNEARISTTFQHPNVVQTFDFGEAAGRPFIAMEFLHGRDLAQLLGRSQLQDKPVPVEIAFAIVIELCRALEYVHEKKDLDGRALNLVHRDVSPGNVLLTVQGGVRLMDFGVAAAAVSEQPKEMIVGKQRYSCPEQLCGGAPSPGWDVFAAGRIFEDLLLLSPKKAVHPALFPLVSSATADDPAKRLQSARVFREQLEALQKRIPRGANLGAFVQELFGAELSAEEAEYQALMAEARKRFASSSSPLLRPFRALRRKVAGSRFYLRHRRLFWALNAAVLAAALGGGGALVQRSRHEAALVAKLLAVDERISSGRLVGPGGDTALDLLQQTLRLSPGEPRALARLERLADTFEKLGDAALARADLAEAVVHFEAASLASSNRKGVAEKLADVEGRVRGQSKPKKRGP